MRHGSLASGSLCVHRKPSLVHARKAPSGAEILRWEGGFQSSRRGWGVAAPPYRPPASRCHLASPNTPPPTSKHLRVLMPTIPLSSGNLPGRTHPRRAHLHHPCSPPSASNPNQPQAASPWGGGGRGWAGNMVVATAPFSFLWELAASLTSGHGTKHQPPPPKGGHHATAGAVLSLFGMVTHNAKCT